MSIQAKKRYVYLVTPDWEPDHQLGGPYSDDLLGRRVLEARDEIAATLCVDSAKFSLEVLTENTVELLRSATRPYVWCDFSTINTTKHPVGTTVICRYRVPTDVQPWVSPILIGTIEEPGTDPAAWNGSNSEASYCTETQKARVRYGSGEFSHHPRGGVVYDTVCDLYAVSPDIHTLSERERVLRVLGPKALATYDFYN